LLACHAGFNLKIRIFVLPHYHMEKRKKDHIEFALNSRTLKEKVDKRFAYEPMFSAHPAGQKEPFNFLGKRMRVPLWVSSMTGGTRMAGTINRNLARVCHEFGMGMGLGSCRIIMDDDSRMEDFDVRSILGDEQPLYANLGLAQLEDLIESNRLDRVEDLLERLQVDGLVVHVNPLQEWCQPEGDRFRHAPVDTLKRLVDRTDFRIIVKEVGQGMGPESLRVLLKLPIEAIEFAAFGGTNFSMVEISRCQPAMQAAYGPIAFVGHTAEDMIDMVNRIIAEEKEVLCHQLIISGGIQSFLDGYYLVRKSGLPAIYGQASGFLEYARGDYESLREYVDFQVTGYQLAEAYLIPKFD
jgi:isopentenyl-diphosphate delta-isomerase